MDDGTSEARHCDVCGGPLRSTNISGVCQSTPECRKERSRRDPRRAPGPKAPPRYCRICGKPIQQNNAVGICTGPDSPRECQRARENLERRASGIPPRKRNECERPRCHRSRKRGGVCAMHWSRFERTGDYGPDEILERELIEVRAGETFGQWTALEGGSGVVSRVLCRCECGTERPVSIASLAEGRSLSCGQTCKARRAANPYLLPGTYGQLEVLEAALRSKDLVRVHCNRCGRDTTKEAFLMKRGITATCGCGRGKFTHGLSKHPLYGTWNGMWDRCTNPKATGYAGYGACNITPCAGWQGAPEGLLNFIADMGERPDGMTLDRIDVEGGYWCGHCAECVANDRPFNCRWATDEQQSRNKRSVGKLAQQRNAAIAAANAALAEVERLNQALASAPRKRAPLAVTVTQEALF